MARFNAEQQAAAAAEKAKADMQAMWSKELQKAVKFFADSLRHGQKVYRRYIDEREDSVMANNGVRRANYFYANCNTIKESLYNSLPKPDVSRLHKDDTEDEPARVAASIVSRALTYEVQRAPSFDAAVKAAILDRLVPGVGVSWLRFGHAEFPPDQNPVNQFVAPGTPAQSALPATSIPVPSSNPGVQQAAVPGAATTAAPPEMPPSPSAKSETIFVDILYWEDFIYEPARVWEQVTWLGRKLNLSKENYEKKFGTTGDMVAEKNDSSILTPKELTEGKYKAWEIWDRKTRKVMFFSCIDYKLLKVVPDPYGLRDFWPCPKPMIANATTNKCLPLTDYHIAQDQYLTLDELTVRSNLIIEAIKVAGVYDAANPSIARMLGGQENKLIPVDNWGLFAEKGGMKGQIDWYPVETVVQVLENLYKAIEATKNTLYEITGMSDIIRGVSNPYETKGAQEIKAQFASVRMGAFQRDVAMFVRDILRIIAEMACQLYSDEKFQAIVGNIADPDRQFIESAMIILRDDFFAQYKVDIQADSLTQADWSLEKQQRQELVSAVGQLLQSSTQVVQQQPALAPLMVQLIKFSVAGFKGASELEGHIDQAASAMAQAAANPQPDPKAAEAQQKAQMEQQRFQQEMQQSQQKFQQDSQLAQQTSQQDAQQAALAQQTTQANIEKMMIAMRNAQSKMQMDQTKMFAQLEFMREKHGMEMQIAEANLEAAEQKSELNGSSHAE